MSDTSITETASEPQDNGRQEFIRGLRDAATFFETVKGVPIPPGGLQVNLFVNTREELVAVARAHPAWAKGYNNNYMWLRVSFSGEVCLDVNIEREKVCRKIVHGTRTEPARIVEDCEWICEDALLADIEKTS